jgi:putative methionine-R-sulfoxide reductase with GAF domain
VIKFGPGLFSVICNYFALPISSCLLLDDLGLICTDQILDLMAAIFPVLRPASSNRRSRVRQKVHVPAYASFISASQPDMLDLYEVLDISESGLALHCASPMEINQTVELSLDLAEADAQISGIARVAWSDASGRVGMGLPILADSAKRQLSEWLFLNVLAAAANADLPAERFQGSENDSQIASRTSLPRQNYTDTLSAASAVQREAESLGPDLEGVLALVASRSRSLLRASGAAVALEEKTDQGKDTDTDEDRTMICRASSGTSAPPVGVTLQVGSGFSGECVRTGTLLRCDDTETDPRVDRQSCRALGIRSLVAAPVRRLEKVIGLLEVFSAEPAAFSENDSAVLQRLAETIQAAMNRSERINNDQAAPPPAAPPPFSPSPGSVLFAHPPERETEKEKERSDDRDRVGGIRLPRAYLYLLFAAAATIFLVLGFLAEPWIRAKFDARGRGGESTVLASTKPTLASDSSNSAAAVPSADSGSLAQLLQMADRGDATAENALGLLYAAGDEKQGVKRDEMNAARWFTKAAEHGSVPAQSKLGSLYWGGRGVAADNSQAYFWTVLARASGDNASQALAPFIATRLTRAQRAAIEQQAEQWLERHESAQPVASR